MSNFTTKYFLLLCLFSFPTLATSQIVQNSTNSEKRAASSGTSISGHWGGYVICVGNNNRRLYWTVFLEANGGPSEFHGSYHYIAGNKSGQTPVKIRKNVNNYDFITLSSNVTDFSVSLIDKVKISGTSTNAERYRYPHPNSCAINLVKVTDKDWYNQIPQ